jgi:hypothetical protein
VKNNSKDIMFFNLNSWKGTHGGRKSRGKWRWRDDLLRFKKTKQTD